MARRLVMERLIAGIARVRDSENSGNAPASSIARLRVGRLKKIKKLGVVGVPRPHFGNFGTLPTRAWAWGWRKLRKPPDPLP